MNPSEKVEVYWADLLLWQAAKYATDSDNWWAATQPALMERFGIGVDVYWDMTVADHARLVDYLGGFGEPEAS